MLGRAAALADVLDRLSRNRLVTITGPGGIGKTTLAICVAHQRDHARVCRFVDLASLAPGADAATVTAAVAAAGGGAGRGATGGGADDGSEPGPLIVLDNCEHVIDAAGVVIAELLERGAVTILATSRTRLDLPAEVTYELSGLDLEDAAALYVARAGQLDQELDANDADVRDICDQLDRLPLAIELAAARTRVHSPAEMLAHLADSPLLTDRPGRGRPPRHRTLRAGVEWSFELLDDEQRSLFLALSVAAGRFDMAQAEALGGPSAIPIADRLCDLVDQSLVQSVRMSGAADRTWFRVLHIVRAYARERLAATGDTAAANDRLVAWVFDVTASLDVLVTSDVRAASYDRIDITADDITTCLCHLFSSDRHGEALALTVRLWLWWHIRGRLGEGRMWLAKAIACDPGDDAQTTARALNGAANLAQAANDLGAARTLYERCLDVRRTIGAEDGIATTLNDLGACCLHGGDLDAANVALRQAHTLHEMRGDRWGQACAATNLALTAQAMGDLVRAATLTTQARVAFSELGDEYAAIACVANLATIDLALGDLDEAGRGAALALDRALDLGAIVLLAPILDGAAEIAAALDEPARRAALAVAAEEMRSRAGTPIDAATATALAMLVIPSLEHGPATAMAPARDTDADPSPHRGTASSRGLGGEVERPHEATRSPQPRTGRLVRTGDVWSVQYSAPPAHLRASKGLGYLAQLLATPDVEHHVLDLVGAGITLAGGTGPALDEHAKRDLRQRWDDLNADLAEAEGWGDADRAATARAELDELARAVAAAVGLGGRDRSIGDPVERARKAVTNRLRHALDRIAAVDPSLGRHLDNGVRTGTYCVYRPEQPIAWIIEG